MKVGRFIAVTVAGLLAGCGGAVASTPTALPPASHASDVTPVPTAPPIAAAEAMPASPPSAPPTWSALFAEYFGPGSPGSCGRASRCHAEDMHDAASAYTWLSRRGYIDGTRSALVSPSNSCLRWFGGNMPPQGQPAEDATRDLQAWVAAGAPDD